MSGSHLGSSPSPVQKPGKLTVPSENANQPPSPSPPVQLLFNPHYEGEDGSGRDLSLAQAFLLSMGLKLTFPQ